MTDTYEHLEVLPDQNEVDIMESVDDNAFGVTGRRLDYEPSREQEAQALAQERNDIATAAREIAMVLANTGKQVSRVQPIASQSIMRTVSVPSGYVAEKLVSENFERSSLKIEVMGDEPIAISTTQINATFALASNEIPSNSIVLNPGRVYEIRTTDSLYALAEASVIVPTNVCILEEFNS